MTWVPYTTFLSIEVIYQPLAVLISQRKYITDDVPKCSTLNLSTLQLRRMLTFPSQGVLLTLTLNNTDRLWVPYNIYVDTTGQCVSSKSSESVYAFSYGDTLGHCQITTSTSQKHHPSWSLFTAEHRSPCKPFLIHANTELSWFLDELGIYYSSPLVLQCDNIGATYLAANPILHARIKHMTDYHFFQENVTKYTLDIQFISSKDGIADIMTKRLIFYSFYFSS